MLNRHDLDETSSPSVTQICACMYIGQKLQLGGSFIQNCGPFEQNTGLLTILWFFQTKVVDLLFERVVLQHLQRTPLATGLYIRTYRAGQYSGIKSI